MNSCFECNNECDLLQSHCTRCGTELLQNRVVAPSTMKSNAGTASLFSCYVDPFKQFANITGRTGRKAYWMFTLINMLIAGALGGLCAQIGLTIISTLYSLMTIIPAVTIGVRRLHDIDRSGWWLIAPLYNVYLLAQPGTQGINQFGPSSKSTV